MGNQTNTIGTSISFLVIIVIILGGLYFVSEDISSNPNLDSESQALILEINYEYSNNFDSDTLINTSEGNYTFAGEEDFSRQYLEDKTEISQKKSTLNKILNIPGLALKIFGVSNAAIIIAWNTLVYGLLVTLISLQIYKAVRTGEVD